jgi:CHAT domain-containing protein/predicted negative regulator of RcsB-dependent stress response
MIERIEHTGNIGTNAPVFLRSGRLCVVLILFFFFCSIAIGQERQGKEDNDKKLKEEILTVFKTKGEEGLRNFVKKEKHKFTKKFIGDFAEAGVTKRNEEWLKICEIIANELNDRKALIDVYLRMSRFFRLISENKKALDSLDKALPICTTINSQVGLGNVYFLKGIIFFTTKDNANAIKMYDKALFFFEKAAKPLPRSLGNVCFFMALIHSRTGDNEKALNKFFKALSLFRKVTDHMSIGNVYHGIGGIYLKTGDYLRALEMYEEAQKFYSKAGHILGEANVYLKKGTIYFYIGRNTNAFEMYEKALQLFREKNNIRGQANVYIEMGEIFSSSNNYTSALEKYRKALFFFKKAEDRLGQGNVHLKTGDVYYYKKEYARALEMYNKALLFFESVGDIESESYTLHGKAKLLAKSGKKKEALQLFVKGIANLEKVRSQTSFSEMKKTFMQKVYNQYEETVMFMLDNRYDEMGLKYAESMRSRVFLDRMAEGLVKLEKGLTTDLKEKRDKLVAKLSQLGGDISNIKGEEKENKRRLLQEQYLKIQNQFEELLVNIRLNNPLYAAVRYPEPVSVKELQKNVLQKEDFIIRYFAVRDNIYVFLVSKNEFKTVKLKAGAKEIEKLVAQHMLSIEEKNTKGVKGYGSLLYRKLVKPLEPAIKKRKRIIIIPDGNLARIPFESLVIGSKSDKKPVYLLERYRVKYIQSASILAILRKHYRRNSLTKHFIGFGDPVYIYPGAKAGKPALETAAALQPEETGSILRSRYRKEGGTFIRLKASGEEIEAIADLFKNQSQKSVVYLQEQANETNAKSPAVKAFDYIHFACHAISGDSFQTLVLSRLPPSQSTEDGFFTLNEIMNCDYHAKLVVLSACRTGKGKLERGEGVTGLTRAVMYAGTPAVVASLWNVHDEATKELMVRFYKYMLDNGLAKEDALRQAKLDLIKGKKYASPFFWSAFVMYGE